MDFKQQRLEKRARLKLFETVQQLGVCRYGLKFFLCIFWNSSDVLYYEPLEKE